MPSSVLYEDAPVEMVIVPGGDGMFGVMPSHVPTIAELKPGVVSVQETAGGPLTKYFISGGFMSSAPRRAAPCSSGGTHLVCPLFSASPRPRTHTALTRPPLSRPQ